MVLPAAAFLRTAVAVALLTLVSATAPTPTPASAAPSAVDEAQIIRPEEGEILRLYRSVLDREPDEGGFDYWVSARIEGVPLSTVAGGFLDSREYRLRFGTGTDTEFVERTYSNVLDRPSEPAGRDYWLEQLADGLARTQMVLLFSESIEHRNRTGTTLPELPPFRPVVSTVSKADVSASWRPGCPVDPGSLRAVELDHVDFGGRHRRGTLVVHSDVVDQVTVVFSRLYGTRYPIASLAPIDVFAGDDNASMAANNTSAFNCRPLTGGQSWSQHSYGTAIDINPIQNPYIASGVVLPPLGIDFIDRSIYHPAMIRPADVVTTAFGDLGWRWGGDFRSLKDHQHFER